MKVCKHIVKMVSFETVSIKSYQGKEWEEGKSEGKIERELSVDVSIKFPCALLFVSFVLKPLHFFCKSFPILFLFLCYPYFSTFLFHVVLLHH